MAYIVVNRFKDLDDENRVYKVGQEYPQGNYEPTEERIAQLSAVHSKYKRVFIEKVEDGSGDKGNIGYTQAELKKLNKAEQEEIISDLNGDLGTVKNEDERITLIIQLQENSQVTPNE